MLNWSKDERVYHTRQKKQNEEAKSHHSKVDHQEEERRCSLLRVYLFSTPRVSFLHSRSSSRVFLVCCAVCASNIVRMKTSVKLPSEDSKPRCYSTVQPICMSYSKSTDVLIETC